MENLTNWKKNNDSRYISGEDLNSGLKGLKPEMVVSVSSFADMETFDQQKQSKIIKTGFNLKELNGTVVYKPVILNNTNAKFFANEFKSDFMEHWLNKPVVLYAQPDKRHGFVARFKKYYPPATITSTNALAKLIACKTLAELGLAWGEISHSEQKLPDVLAKKNELKEVLV